MLNDKKEVKNGNSDNKLYFILGLIFLIFALITFIIDLILFYNNVDIDNILKIIEILFSSSAAISLSITLSVNITKNIEIKKNKVKGKGLAINESENVDLHGMTLLSGDNPNLQIVNIGAGFKEFLEVYDKVLLPHQIKNAEEIARKTYEELSKQNSEKEINKDFVIKYMEDSKNISDKDIQDIWVKLLLLESKSSSVSKRTLDIIKNMTSEEAKTFELIASLSTERNIIPKDFEDDGYNWSSISLLQDIGLVKSGDLTVNTLTLTNPNQLFCSNKNLVLILNNVNANNNQTFKTPCFVLTSEGAQLKEALSIQMNDETILKLARKIKNRINVANIKVSVHKIIGIVGTQVHFSNQDLLN